MLPLHPNHGKKKKSYSFDKIDENLSEAKSVALRSLNKLSI